MTDLHYKCDRCDLSLFTKYLPRVYTLDAERQVTMEQRHFWCTACDQFSVCESLAVDQADIDAVEEQLREMRNLRDMPAEQVAALALHKQYPDVEKWIGEFEAAGRDWDEWRAQRTGPAKCLRCGVVVADVPVTRWSAFTHGKCGGTIRCGVRIGSSTGPGTFPHQYSIEGALVEQGRKPVKTIWAPTYQVSYEALELFFQPLDHDPYEEFEKSLRKDGKQS